ncbi:hypothetical protein [Nocardioides lianchengensis]|uniref:Endonuclease/Exonuclease/phosphatase family protein n=1 Tax=Nocardioides lianchengensis TaxID=1045774 RepID=A0A1G6Z6B2_9ACTN|nr:hypothetical protein [Nocardioides lianchengensis]NYG11499.1 hypothetical protein [Nocardioides lianchengensis]SDD98209.1 Endonuclease/Exonuclease/phosphatase family protein [Nocardioides lianchengensis]
MPARPARHRPRAVVATVAVLVAGLVAVLGGQGPASVAQAARTANPTGTAAGSPPNGVGNLRVGLAATADGRIRVTWDRSRARQLKWYVVQVSPGRRMEAQVRSYRVGRTRGSLVVPRAVGATPASGNFSFVRVVAHLRRGGATASQTKWIQAPLGSRCTAAARDRVILASFNMQTWAADRHLGPGRNWTRRGDNVVREILRSGAHAIAIQETSGSTRVGFGDRPQKQWVLDRLNEVDPDPSAHWVDAVDDEYYRPPEGRVPGLVGTRVFYDASKYDALDAGLERIIDPAFDKDSLIPWVRLQSVRGDQAPFVLTSNHLRVGVVGSTTEWHIRARQTARTIAVMRALRQAYGDQVFLAGDLNSTSGTLPSNNVHQALMAAGFYDAYATTRIVGGQYPTTQDSRFPVHRTPLRRDYLLSLGTAKGSCGYRNQTYASADRVASDHFLQVAVLPLPPL